MTVFAVISSWNPVVLFISTFLIILLHPEVKAGQPLRPNLIWRRPSSVCPTPIFYSKLASSGSLIPLSWSSSNWPCRRFAKYLMQLFIYLSWFAEKQEHSLLPYTPFLCAGSIRLLHTYDLAGLHVFIHLAQDDLNSLSQFCSSWSMHFSAVNGTTLAVK